MKKKRNIDAIIVLFAFLVLSSILAKPTQAVINVKDFGAKGDGVTDDTSAIRAAFKAAHEYKQEKMTPNYHRKYGYFTTFPEVYFPSGHYIIHETIDISGPNIRGEGSAAIEQKEPEKDIFYCSSTWQRTIEGLTFLGGKTQLNLGNKNVDKGLVEIRDCKFYHSDDVGVLMRKGSYSTTFQIRSCLFKECEQAVIGNSDYTVIRDTWITSSRRMKGGQAVIENRHGTMTLDHIVGVPLVSEADQRWVDNYDNLICKEVRFGGEGGGFTPIVNFAKRRPEVDGPFILVEDCAISAQGGRQCAVYLEEIPNAIWIKRSGLSGVEALRISPDIDLETYFAGVKPGMLRFSIEDNIGEFVGELPELLKNPVLEGLSESDRLPSLSEEEANQAITSVIAEQTKFQKSRKKSLPVKYRDHRQQISPDRYMEIAFDKKKWTLDDNVDALSSKNSKYLAVASAGDDVIVLRKRTDKWPHVLIRDVTIDLDKFPFLAWKLTNTGKGQQAYAIRAVEKKSQAIATWEKVISKPWDAYHAYDLREEFNFKGGTHTFDLKFYFLPWSYVDSDTSVSSELGDYLVIDFIRCEQEQDDSAAKEVTVRKEPHVLAGNEIIKGKSFASNALKIGVEGPFIISDQQRRPGYAHFHYHMARLPSGRLFLSIGKERDIVDQERFLLVSDDKGRTWLDGDVDSWPPARFPGFGSSHWVYVNLDDQTILSYLNMSFVTSEKGVYQVPMWVSRDGGSTWGSMQSARVEIPGVEDVDFYNPPDWWREKHQREIKLGFIKPEPPESLRDLFSHFNPARARASWEQICQLKDNRLLGVISSSGKDRLAEAVVVQSEDQGQSWKFLSFAARYDPKHVDQTVAHKPTELDGFCEPSIVQFPDGELLVVMRLGSHHPLYSVRSQDGGQTWTEPKRLTARSVQPKLVVMQNGVLALGTGRPRELVEFSLDQGRTWSHRVYPPETDGVAGAFGGANSNMIEVEPNRLLYAYSCYNWDENGADYWLKGHGHSRTLGTFINVDVGK